MKKEVIIEMTKDEIVENPFYLIDEAQTLEPAFYRFLGDTLCGGYDTNVVSLDCTKIIVSEHIMNSWYDAVKDTAVSKEKLTRDLLLFGPKASPKLADNQVLLQEGWADLKDASVMQAS